MKASPNRDWLFYSIPDDGLIESKISRKSVSILSDLTSLIDCCPTSDSDLRTELFFLSVRIWVVIRERGDRLLATKINRFLIDLGRELEMSESGLQEYGLN